MRCCLLTNNLVAEVNLNRFSTEAGEASVSKKVEDMTYYEILGLDRHASSKDIKDAFREMGVSRCHEDQYVVQFNTRQSNTST